MVVGKDNRQFFFCGECSHTKRPVTAWTRAPPATLEGQRIDGIDRIRFFFGSSFGSSAAEVDSARPEFRSRILQSIITIVRRIMRHHRNQLVVSKTGDSLSELLWVIHRKVLRDFEANVAKPAEVEQ